MDASLGERPSSPLHCPLLTAGSTLGSYPGSNPGEILGGTPGGTLGGSIDTDLGSGSDGTLPRKQRRGGSLTPSEADGYDLWYDSHAVAEMLRLHARAKALAERSHAPTRAIEREALVLQVHGGRAGSLPPRPSPGATAQSLPIYPRLSDLGPRDAPAVPSSLPKPKQVASFMDHCLCCNVLCRQCGPKLQLPMPADKHFVAKVCSRA